jgi:serine/threonine protein kinase
MTVPRYPTVSRLWVASQSSRILIERFEQIVKDFLYHCFQKDSNLRVSAKKLLRHPWMASARKHLGSEKPHGEKILYYDEAVQRVQEWNEALKCMCDYAFGDISVLPVSKLHLVGVARIAKRRLRRPGVRNYL